MTVSDACKTTYEEIKKDKKHRYVVFYIRDEKQIDVETVGERNAEYDQFLEDLQKGGTGECRFVSFIGVFTLYPAYREGDSVKKLDYPCTAQFLRLLSNGTELQCSVY